MSTKPGPHTALLTLVRNRRSELGISLREVATRSGGLISPATVSNIERGVKGNTPSDRVIRGLARGLSLAESQVREAAERPPYEPPPFQLPDRAKHLTQEQRLKIKRMVDAMLREAGDT